MVRKEGLQLSLLGNDKGSDAYIPMARSIFIKHEEQHEA